MYIKLIKLFYSFCVIFFLTFIFPSVCWATTYYASPSGTSSSCTASTSPCSLSAGLGKLGGGDTLILADGNYLPSSYLNISTNSVTVKAANRRKATINGVNVSLSVYGGIPLIALSGDNINLQGLHVINSESVGIHITGSNNTLTDLEVDHCQENGILITNKPEGGNYDRNCTFSTHPQNNVVEDSEIHHNTLLNEGGGASNWPTGMSAARCPYGTIFRRNIVHDNWGEGLSAFDAHNTLIEDNIVYDNWAINLYLDGAPGTTVQRNLIYTSGPNAVGYKNAPGIAFCDELSGAQVTSTGVKIINNFVKGGNGAFYYFQQAGTGTKSFVIANNTFVGSDSNAATLNIESGNFSGSRIENNIFVAGSGGLTYVSSTSGITFSHNLWSTSGGISGTGDVIGDPVLAKTGGTGAGLLSPNWFKLRDTTSAAIGRGTYLSDVPRDFFNAERKNPPDIGAHEYVSSGGATPTVTPTPTPSVVCLGADLTINADDLTAWVKSYSSINNVLKFAALISHWGASCRQ